MVDNEKILEFMNKMYTDLKGSQEKMYTEMQDGFKNVNNRLSSLGKTVTIIENVHGDIYCNAEGYID
ncbi:MAG: hypothetical protein DDT30_01860 [Dehalococcoidia bacterium]|nr:hypothetical protein [Bacillota bacterium]MBT9143635.1 hypothetical protein [Bacillota bacterium]